MKLNPWELQMLSMVTAEAHGNVPLSLQVTPQKGRENAEEQPETRVPLWRSSPGGTPSA